MHHSDHDIKHLHHICKYDSVITTVVVLGTFHSNSNSRTGTGNRAMILFCSKLKLELNNEEILSSTGTNTGTGSGRNYINSINRNSFVVVVLPTTQIFKTKLMTLIQFTMQYQICTIHLVPTLVIVQL